MQVICGRKHSAVDLIVIAPGQRTIEVGVGISSQRHGRDVHGRIWWSVDQHHRTCRCYDGSDQSHNARRNSRHHWIVQSDPTAPNVLSAQRTGGNCRHHHRSQPDTNEIGHIRGSEGGELHRELRHAGDSHCTNRREDWENRDHNARWDRVQRYQFHGDAVKCWVTLILGGCPFVRATHRKLCCDG